MCACLSRRPRAPSQARGVGLGASESVAALRRRGGGGAFVRVGVGPRGGGLARAGDLQRLRGPLAARRLVGPQGSRPSLVQVPEVRESRQRVARGVGHGCLVRTVRVPPLTGPAPRSQAAGMLYALRLSEPGSARATAALLESIPRDFDPARSVSMPIRQVVKRRRRDPRKEVELPSFWDYLDVANRLRSRDATLRDLVVTRATQGRKEGRFTG